MADLTPAPFEDAVHLAAAVCAAPLALVAFLEPRRLRIRAATAPLPGDLPREFGFCARTVAACEPVVIPDTHLDPGAAGNAALGPPWFAHFYAGVPIEACDGPPGALEIYDHVPRRLEPWQMEGLRRLARIVGQSMAAFVAQRDRETRRARIVAAVAGGLAAEIKRNSGRLGPSRAADLARQLLALAGHRSLRPQPIDLNALLARVAEGAWSLTLDPAAGEVYGDEERIGLAIRGLAARAAGPRRQPVPIATRDLVVPGPGEGALLAPGRYVMVTIGAPPAVAMEEFAGWFETVPAIDPAEEGPGPAIAELSGLLIESGGRLGCRPQQSGGPAYCLALPRATGAS